MATKTNDLYVATESFVSQDGTAYFKDITRVSGKVVAKRGWDHLFKPIEASHMSVESEPAPEIEEATAAPGTKRGG